MNIVRTREFATLGRVAGDGNSRRNEALRLKVLTNSGRRRSVVELVQSLRPEEPLHCVRPHLFTEAATRFNELFRGDVLYAVKCNPQPAALKALHAAGIVHFDVASLGEVKLVAENCPNATMHFMHPIKARSAIRSAYAEFGVRDFVLDSIAELGKILEETDRAGDLGLVVRLALPKGNAVYDLSGKFGAEPSEAAAVLRAARPAARRLGISFHVGSQMLDPGAYESALALAGKVLADSGVTIDILDVGGGFPVSYENETPPPLTAFMMAIERGVAKLRLPQGCRLWCEPGRALVAAGQSIVVQVQARRKGMLYINDGIYGALSDAGPAVGLRFPVRLIRADRRVGRRDTVAFQFFGPTCDSADRMKGPFVLPADVREGDWIEIGQLGAYSTALASAFNGFDQALLAEVSDRPLVETPAYVPAACRVA
jgi:ornithine decarboxylase